MCLPDGCQTIKDDEMRAPKLIHYMKRNAGQLSEAVRQKIRASERCADLCSRVSDQEQKRSTMQVYSDLIDWLATETGPGIGERYIALGTQRAQQGVPFSDLFWGICIAHEYLWEYMQQECLLEEPVEFWGGVALLRSLTQFFDRALYFALIDYQKAEKGEFADAVLAQR
jgi:hypothetical protein